MESNLEKITLGDFVDLYVDTSLKFAENDLFLDNFDYGIWERVSNKTPLPFAAVKYLHHPFHSAFFNDRNSNSPLTLLNPEKNWQPYLVHLDKNLLFNQQRLTEYILEKSGVYLRKRWDILSKDNFSISHHPLENKKREHFVLLKEFSSEIADYCKKENKRVHIFGGLILDRYILFCAIKFRDFKLSVRVNEELSERCEKDYTIDLDLIKINYCKKN